MSTPPMIVNSNAFFPSLIKLIAIPSQRIYLELVQVIIFPVPRITDPSKHKETAFVMHPTHRSLHKSTQVTLILVVMETKGNILSTLQTCHR